MGKEIIKKFTSSKCYNVTSKKFTVREKVIDLNKYKGVSGINTFWQFNFSKRGTKNFVKVSCEFTLDSNFGLDLLANIINYNLKEFGLAKSFNINDEKFDAKVDKFNQQFNDNIKKIEELILPSMSWLVCRCDEFRFEQKHLTTWQDFYSNLLSLNRQTDFMALAKSNQNILSVLKDEIEQLQKQYITNLTDMINICPLKIDSETKSLFNDKIENVKMIWKNINNKK